MGNNILGSRIKSLRQKSGYTQIDLAKKISISNTTLSQYESGIRVPSDDIKMKIASLFSVSVDYLLGVEKSTAPKERYFSDEIKELYKESSDLSEEEIKKVREYVEFLKLKRNS